MIRLESLPEELLSDDRTRELLLSSQEGDEEAKEILVHYNLRLVLKIVHRFKDKGYEMDDLFQIGTIGLLHAIQKFDLTRGVKFSTYAVPLILGEIMRYLRDDSAIRVSRSLKKVSKEIRRSEEEFWKDHGRSPTLKELSSILGLSSEEIVLALEGTKKPLSIYQKVDTGGSEKDLFLLEQLADSSISRLKILDRLDLKKVIGLLPERERKILFLRYFKEKTQEEVGEIMGLSQVQISRIERKVLERLRAHLTGTVEYLRETGEN